MRFGPFQLDVRAGEICHGVQRVRLHQQSLEILLMLLEHPGEVVLREEIRKRLWPNDTVVEFDHSINAAIKKLRRALEDDAGEPRYIETLARRGYRLMLNAESVQNAIPSRPTATQPPSAVGALMGKKVSHYRVLEILGGGGMGLVYKAEDLKLGRSVALKFLPDELANDPTALARFEREARAASALNHPNICTIHEIEEHESQPFLVMELLEGETLRDLIAAAGPAKPPLELDKLLGLAIQIVEGLEAAHGQGIVHRDIKPANIFVTRSRQVKILDFGLAKLVRDGDGAGRRTEGGIHGSNGTERTHREHLLVETSDLSISRTGVAMGTAGYMSPEQVRGEKLDARSDLFSFGLVLYEAATGVRAFKGDSGPAVQESILTQTPSPAREVNPALPPRLEEIITKSLKKDRDARYQTAAAVRADLEALAGKTSKKHVTRRSALAWAGVAAILIFSAIFWLRRHPSSSPITPDLKMRQLTANSRENLLLSGAISPDGKYLAYSDTKGMHVKILETGEIKPIPQPAGLDVKDVDWEIMPAWLADGTTFVVNSHPAGEDGGSWSSPDTSIWSASVLGGPPRKLREKAQAYSISPDRSLIAFGSNKSRFGEGEAWLMGTDGENARRVLAAPEDGPIDWLDWSRDQQRFNFVKFDARGAPVLMSRDVNGGPLATIFAAPEFGKIDELAWLPDGRLLYELPESGPLSRTCNFWVTRIDLHSGERIEQPRRLTNWTGICPSYSSSTADGKRLAFRLESSRQTVYIADLDPSGKHIVSSREFTPEIGGNPMDWTPDSKSVIFFSSRNDEVGIFKQSLDKDLPELIASASGDFNGARITPDGKWVLWWLVSGSRTERPFQLMRAPTQGGTPEVVFTARTEGQVDCAKSQAGSCVIVERTAEHNQMIVTTLDPLKGRGAELFRYAVDPKLRWAPRVLSPDGSRIAAVIGKDQPIQIFSLHGKLLQLVATGELRDRQIMFWAADGKGLFVTNGVKGGSGLFHVDLKGHATFIWKNNGGYYPWGLQSPDGRHLAIQGSILDANMWMMENF